MAMIPPITMPEIGTRSGPKPMIDSMIAFSPTMPSVSVCRTTLVNWWS